MPGALRSEGWEWAQVLRGGCCDPTWVGALLRALGRFFAAPQWAEPCRPR